MNEKRKGAQQYGAPFFSLSQIKRMCLFLDDEFSDHSHRAMFAD